MVQAIERTTLSRDVTEWKSKYTTESGMWKVEGQILRDENKTLRSDYSACNERVTHLSHELELMKKSSGIGSEKQIELLVKMQLDNEVLRKQQADSMALGQQLSLTEAKYKEMMDKAAKMEALRKKMHNQIQERTYFCFCFCCV